VPEVVRDGVTGFLIPAEDAGGYADRMARLLADAELCGRLTEQAHAQVQRNHTWAAYCERMGTLYRDLMGTAEPRRVQRGCPMSAGYTAESRP
jgi:glycosyltransferase involved in cell wall biosynthesis